MIKDSGHAERADGEHASLVFLVGVRVNPEVFLTPSQPAYDSGPDHNLHRTVFGGIGPFDIELYNVTGRSRQTGTSNVVIPSGGNAVFQFPANELDLADRR